jgi:hypothetical protein
LRRLLVYPSWPESATYTVNYLVHGANLVVMIADCSLCAQPFPLRYSSALLPYGAVYITFTVLYYAAGGCNEWGQEWIYLPIWWGGPAAGAGAALCLVLLVFFVPGLILAAWAAVRWREAWAAGGSVRPTTPTAGGRRADPMRRGLLLPLREADEEGEEAATAASASAQGPAGAGDDDSGPDELLDGEEMTETQRLRPRARAPAAAAAAEAPGEALLPLRSAATSGLLLDDALL